MKHLTPDEIEALVMRGDPLADAARRHLATCAACARQVEREARLELSIYEAAAALGDERASNVGADRIPSPVWRYALAAAAVLVLGAVGLLGLRRDRPLPPPWAVGSTNRPGGGLVAPRPVNATLPRDTPCLRDPRSYMPGFDVVPPEPPGSRATTQAFRP